MMKKRRTIIALEGIDGAGKSTLVSKLQEYYGEKCIVYYRTKKNKNWKRLLANSFIQRHRVIQSVVYLLLSYKNYIRLIDKGKARLIIMDRCFLSNICYYFQSALQRRFLFKLLMLLEIKLFPVQIFIVDEIPSIAYKRSGYDKNLQWLESTRNNYLRSAEVFYLKQYNITIISPQYSIQEKLDFLIEKIDILLEANYDS